MTEPRADGRQERGDRRRRMLIDAARRIFSEHGYRGTTLKKLIEQAGGSRRMIYRSFGGKPGLFRAVITEIGERMEIASPPSESSDPDAFLSDFGRRLLTLWYSEDGRRINRVLLSEASESRELMRAWFEAGPKPALQMLVEYLAAQHRAGTLHIADATWAARQLFLLFLGESAFPYICGEEPDAIELQVTRSVDLFLRAHQPVATP